MNIEQLRYFVAIIENKTFSQAAITLHISQSSLSKQIIKLEQELGTELFDRSKRQIKVLPIATSIYEDAQIILKSQAHMIQQIQTDLIQDGKEIRMAMLPIFSQYGITKKLTDFSTQHKDVIIHNSEMEERDISYMLAENNMDIYFLRGEYEEMEHFLRYQVSEDELVAVVSMDHRIASLHSIALKQLESEPLLLFPVYTRICKIAEEACIQAGFTPTIKRYGRLHTLLAAAADNEGVVLSMRQSLQQFQMKGLKIIPIQEEIKSYIYMYVSKASLKKQGIRQLIDYFNQSKSK